MVTRPFLLVVALAALLYAGRTLRPAGASLSSISRETAVVDLRGEVRRQTGGTPRREPADPTVATASALAGGAPARLATADVVRAVDLLQRGRDAALDNLRKRAESTSDSLQHSAEVLELQAKLLKYEHSLALLGQGEYRLVPSGKPITRSRGREYLVAYSFAGDQQGARDLVFEFPLDDPRFSDLRVTTEDMRTVERRADLEQAVRFNGKDEAERRALIEKHLAATQRQQQLMDAMAKLPTDAFSEREVLSRAADEVQGDLLPWHFIVSAGSSRVVSRFDPMR